MLDPMHTTTDDLAATAAALIGALRASLSAAERDGGPFVGVLVGDARAHVDHAEAHLIAALDMTSEAVGA